MESYELIRNYKLLFNIYGYWPTLHDGEIHKFVLERKFDDENNCKFSSIEFIIHGWEMTTKIEKGYYKLQKHHLIHFRFDYIDELEIDGFNHQNAINSLEIEVLPKNDKGYLPLSIVIEQCYGISAEFTALSGAIVSVIPCTNEGIRS